MRRLAARLRSPSRRKERAELSFWRERVAQEGKLAHFWYEDAFCRHVGLERSFYTRKRILDIGCGPRGSLEWAHDAARRVGLDPLAAEYQKLGASAHAMEYVAAASERMPLEDDAFDVVPSFNSLDHVDSLEATAREIVRVLAPGGTFVLVVMVGHKPTPMEPHELGWDVVDLFAPPLSLVWERRYEDTHAGSVHEGLIAAVPYDPTDARRRVGLLAARFEAPPAVAA